MLKYLKSSRLVKAAALLALAAAVTGCCISPFGHHHYRGYYQGSQH